MARPVDGHVCIGNVLTILWEQTERKKEVYPVQSFWLQISVDQGQGVVLLPVSLALPLN